MFSISYTPVLDDTAAIRNASFTANNVKTKTMGRKKVTNDRSTSWKPFQLIYSHLSVRIRLISWFGGNRDFIIFVRTLLAAF